MAQRKITSWKEGRPTPLQQALQGTVLFWRENNTFRKNVDFIREAMDRFWCYLLQALCNYLLTWSGLQNHLFTTYDYHISCRVLRFCRAQEELSVSGLKVSQSLTFVWHLYIANFYLEPKEKQCRPISNNKTLTSVSKQNTGPFICFDGLVLILVY